MTSVEEYPFTEMFRTNTLYSQEIPSYSYQGNYEQYSNTFANQEPELNQLQPPFQPQPQPQSHQPHHAVLFSNDQLHLQIEDEITYAQNAQQSAQMDQINPSTFFINQDAGFPPVDAFVPPQLDNITQQQLLLQQHHPLQIQQQEQIYYQQLSQQLPGHQQSIPQHQLHQSLPQNYERSRYLSEPNLLTPINQNFTISAHDSTFSLSPDSVTFSTSSNISQLESTLTIPSSPEFVNIDTHDVEFKSNVQSYRVIRGISSGGSSTKPPKVAIQPNHHYSPVRLDLVMAQLEELCLPQWNEFELEDKRRIIRIERYQAGPKIIAEFSIVGSARENPKPLPSRPGVDVVEVSCLECYSRPSDDIDEEELEAVSNSYSYEQSNFSNDIKRNFYITSVEVIKIVELLIGTESQDAADRRRERGRIRSNLVPFWSKRPVSSRVSQAELRSSPIPSDSTHDFRIELATRIMAYEQRKPRGFDKEVRILKWEKLVPALRRALQSYYAEIPNDFEEVDEET